jgi:hypothetical protein
MSMGALAATAMEAASAEVKRANALWESFARGAERGYTMRAGHMGWSHALNPRIDGLVDGVKVTLEYVITDLQGRTVAMATPAAPLVGHVEITPEGIGSRLAKLFGAQDLVMGHAAFDKKYVVKATREETAKALLDFEACEGLFGIDASRFTYDDGARGAGGGIVTIERPKVEDRESALDVMMKLVARMASVRA